MTAETRDPGLPLDLRERVIAASLRARAAGRPIPPAPEISPAEAFRRAADAFQARWRCATPTGPGRRCATWTCRASSGT